MVDPSARSHDVPGAAPPVSAWLPYGTAPGSPHVISRSTTTGTWLSTTVENDAVPRSMRPRVERHTGACRDPDGPLHRPATGQLEADGHVGLDVGRVGDGDARGEERPRRALGQEARLRADGVRAAGELLGIGEAVAVRIAAGAADTGRAGAGGRGEAERRFPVIVESVAVAVQRRGEACTTTVMVNDASDSGDAIIVSAASNATRPDRCMNTVDPYWKSAS